MSTETRNTLVRLLLFLFAIFLTIGIVEHVIYKLDVPSTLLLIGTFIVGSTVITWVTIWDDRRTRSHLASIKANLAPHGLAVQVCKDGTYAVVSQGALFDEIVTESLSLNELEVWTSGLRYGVLQACARQETRYPEDVEHIGIDGYVESRAEMEE